MTYALRTKNVSQYIYMQSMFLVVLNCLNAMKKVATSSVNTQFVLKMMMVRILLFHQLCSAKNMIVSLEPFKVAFVETTYIVDESVSAVNVCINLTQPTHNIVENTVNVFVIDDSNSIHIPGGSPLASEFLL